MKIRVKVVPNAKKNEVIEGDPIKVRLRARPEKGKANAELIEVLSKHFGVPKRNVRIISGFTSKIKMVEVKL